MGSTSSINQIHCPGCSNVFISSESFKSHLKYDHKALEDDIEALVEVFANPQTLDTKKLEESENQPKSKIFIKDVTLLRKPDLPHDNVTMQNIPNIFDSLDLTTAEDEIFDDFFNDVDDFDFDDSANFNSIPTPEPVPDVEIITPETGKIFVRKNLCNEDDPSADEALAENAEVPTSKIFVRSQESLMSQVVTTDVTKQPSEASTPDCIIVSSEIISEAPLQSKIFIRNIETLQESISSQFYSSATSTPESFINNYPPPNYVREYDNLLEQDPTQVPQQRCKISIKNMNSLIEPANFLMQPPLIFGQAQNLVIHMRPPTDESLISYRDSSITPDTLPGSSNVSTCTDDVIVLDDEALFASNEIVETTEAPDVIIPERNDTPNEKTVLQKVEAALELQQTPSELQDSQPMVSIPMVMDFTETPAEPKRKKMKIIKIIRVKKRKESTEPSSIQVVFRCSATDCIQHFSSERLLMYHRNSHVNGSIVCPECNSDEFKTFISLHTHLWRIHKVDMDLYGCNQCDFKTPVLSRLKNFHEKIHSHEKNFKCQCGKNFKNAKQLRNHEQTHKKKISKLKPVQNDDDGKTKRIICVECNKGFSSESGLYIHSMEHKTIEKKFKCDACEYSTNDHNSFRRHKSQHSNVHQYSCPSCVYTSIQSNTYRKHLEKQHPELAQSLLFKCEFCKFTTISQGKFDGHMIKHCVLDDAANKPGGVKSNTNFMLDQLY